MRKAFYIDNEAEQQKWDDTKRLARMFLIKSKVFYGLMRKCEATIKHPLQAAKTDNPGVFGCGVSRPTEVTAMARYGIIDADAPRWIKAMTMLERQLTQREIMILQTWRTPIKHGENKEAICYELFGETWAYDTMKGVMRELTTRLAAMFMMSE